MKLLAKIYLKSKQKKIYERFRKRIKLVVQITIYEGDYFGIRDKRIKKKRL